MDQQERQRRISDIADKINSLRGLDEFERGQLINAVNAAPSLEPERALLRSGINHSLDPSIDYLSDDVIERWLG